MKKNRRMFLLKYLFSFRESFYIKILGYLKNFPESRRDEISVEIIDKHGLSPVGMI